MHPRQRTSGLVVTDVGSDLVIFDEGNAHLHTLPQPIASVWRACDGAASTTDLAVATGLRTVAVEEALGQLRDAGLLDGEPVGPRSAGRSRRSLVKQATLGVAILSVTAPAAAQAQSGLAVTCTTSPISVFESWCSFVTEEGIDCEARGCPLETAYLRTEYVALIGEDSSLVAETFRNICEDDSFTTIATTSWDPVDPTAYNVPTC